MTGTGVVVVTRMVQVVVRDIDLVVVRGIDKVVVVMVVKDRADGSGGGA